MVIEQEGLLGFENITLCPYDKNLIDIQLLTVADRHYIDHYHQRVWETLSGRLQEDKEALEWLRTATSPL